jgi:membrane protein
MRVWVREMFVKYQADRGTQLAAMIAYYALLAFVPLIFLSVSLLGLFGRADESTYLVKELSRMFPGSEVSTIVRGVNEIQDVSTAIGLIGLALLLWAALGLFGALESAFNIVYSRPNRPFLHGKGLAAALMIGLLVVLFAGLIVASFGQNQLSAHAPGVAGNSVTAFLVSLAASSAASFAFLFVSYYLLTNVPHTLRDVLPGALAATVVLALTFQTLPLYLDLAQGSPALQAFGGPVILLVWLYLMANVIVLGAEHNRWISARKSHDFPAGEALSESRS